jgi:hypothetical protein
MTAARKASAQVVKRPRPDRRRDHFLCSTVIAERTIRTVEHKLTCARQRIEHAADHRCYRNESPSDQNCGRNVRRGFDSHGRAADGDPIMAVTYCTGTHKRRRRVDLKDNWKVLHQHVPHGFMRVSDAIDGLSLRMWGGHKSPSHVRAVRKIVPRASVIYAKWRTDPAKQISTEILNGNIILYVVADPEASAKNNQNKKLKQPMPATFEPVVVPRNVLAPHNFARGAAGLCDPTYAQDDRGRSEVTRIADPWAACRSQE